MHTFGKTVLTVVASIKLAATSLVSAEAFGPGGDTSTMRSLSRSLHRALHGARRMYQYQEKKQRSKQLSAPPGSGEKPACQNNCAETAPTTD
jgi:hypothetical protein